MESICCSGRALTASTVFLEHLSRLSFGVFWVHPLLLELTVLGLGASWTTVPYLCIQIILTVLLSFFLMGAIARFPFSKLLL